VGLHRQLQDQHQPSLEGPTHCDAQVLAAGGVPPAKKQKVSAPLQAKAQNREQRSQEYSRQLRVAQLAATKGATGDQSRDREERY